jgi:predicted AAA+ superfamily ATPase
MKTLPRKHLETRIRKSLKSNKVTILIGPRQVGKTTLAKNFAKHFNKNEVYFFDLEDPTDFDLLENAKLTLESLEGLIIIDEVQRRPELFPYLRVKADQMSKSSRLLLLGSSSRDLIESASESLAGRVKYIEVTGFHLQELPQGTSVTGKLFSQGGFPLSFLAKSTEESFQWRKSYSQSFLERDLRGLGFDLNPQTLRRFLEMLAGYHGQIFNASEIGKSLGFSHTTARKYLDILITTFLIRELKPWHEQILQRQVKQPKIYFRDSGLVNYFLGIRNEKELLRNPRLGSLWEGFALEQVIQHMGAEPEDLYFWALHQSGELDLLWTQGGRKYGFEFKFSDSVSVTLSMRKSLELLRLDHLFIVHPGERQASLDRNITLLPLKQLKTFDAKSLR